MGLFAGKTAQWALIFFVFPPEVPVVVDGDDFGVERVNTCGITFMQLGIALFGERELR